MVPDVFHDNLESSVEQKGGEDMSSVILRARLQLDCIYQLTGDVRSNGSELICVDIFKKREVRKWCVFALFWYDNANHVDDSILE